MKKRFTNNELDRFTAQMIRVFSETNEQHIGPPTPYFMTRVQARIREMQDTSQLWAAGIIGTQRWLVAFSLIALIFLVSNVVWVNTQPSNIEGEYTESLVLSEQESTDWDHFSSDEAPLASKPQKQ